MKIDIPGHKAFDIENLVLDLNGTMAVDGRLRADVVEKIGELNRRGIRIYIATAGTHGGVDELKDNMGIKVLLIKRGNEAEQKRDLIEKIGNGVTAAIGNGANDYLMLERAALSIAVLEEEGIYSKNLLVANMVVRSSESALDLFLNPKRIIATLRK